MALSSETNSQQLPFSIESFTYSWCINLNPPSLESLNNSLRFSLDHTLSDYFDIDILDLEVTDSDQAETSEASNNDQGGELQDGTVEFSWSSNQSKNSMMRRCRSLLSKRMLKRYLGLILIMPICRKVIRGIRSGKRLSSKVDAFDHVLSKRSCDSETSIDEAVLHCKRS